MIAGLILTVALKCAMVPHHRNLCEPETGVVHVMKCGKWATLVRKAEELGPERFGALYFGGMANRFRYKSQNKYYVLFGRDVQQFIVDREFANPDHAFASAMAECGATQL